MLDSFGSRSDQQTTDAVRPCKKRGDKNSLRLKISRVKFYAQKRYLFVSVQWVCGSIEKRKFSIFSDFWDRSDTILYIDDRRPNMSSTWGNNDSHGYVNGTSAPITVTYSGSGSGSTHQPQASHQQWITGSSGESYYNTGYNPGGSSGH